MKKVTRKLRRKVLAVGYPWFIWDTKKGDYTQVMMMDGPNRQEGRKVVPIKFGGLGAYQKIKLVAEYVK
ncbi:hypothetical protein LCGC14_2815840 [marine sediment metagenome]|uniref:Uncharacterized protein n=1 Tax=marine sediment metagenome TaxID=412755 RepID=A0A0F8YIH6_9ZZZZ